MHLVERRREDGVDHGGQGIGLEVQHLAVEPAQDLGRLRGFQRVGAQRPAHLSHDHRGGQAGSGHIARPGAPLPPARRPRSRSAARRKVQQQYRRRVSPQDLSRTAQQLGKQLAVIEPGQRCVRDRLDGPEPGLNRDGIYLRCHLDAPMPKTCATNIRTTAPRYAITPATDRNHQAGDRSPQRREGPGSGFLRPSLFRPRGTAPSDLEELLAEGRTRYHCRT